MDVQIKKLNPNAVIPTYSRVGDAGLDLTAISFNIDYEGNYVYDTGIAVKIPDGHVGYIFPRSSICKKNLMLTNSVGVIDSNYTGSILLKFKPIKSPNEKRDAIKGWFDRKIYEVNERIGQLVIMPIPTINFVEVDELPDTNRGSAGYGSSGN
jgi:dUTP pyrophosphatase